MHKLPEDIDEQIIPLYIEMNRFAGIQTISSCCGHDKDKFCIWFTVEDLEDLPALLYCFDGCHTGIYGWKVIVTTDCAMSPVKFLAESSTMGKKSYEESEVIAKYMKEFLDRVFKCPEESGLK
ncbi:hypothetical protein LCGC14_3057350 [marine sediment metagenome]|uniref:Uncharacterized protein n=1 Tax=marine sediment metagenome TaxID=412755 RepID=A0A0F8WKF2_9ZZZZ